MSKHLRRGVDSVSGRRSRGRTIWRKGRSTPTVERQQPRVEALDRRILLAAVSALPANVFAMIDGAVAAGGAAQQVPIHLTTRDFNFSLVSSLSLGFQADVPAGSTLSPALSLKDRNGRVVSQIPPPTPGAQAALYRLTAGDYTMSLAGKNGTSGAYQLRVFLVGDANGDRAVTAADSVLVANLIQTHAYSAAADANLDGRVGVEDLVLQAANLGASTAIRPLSVTVGLSPAPTKALSDGTPVTRIAAETVTGLTSVNTALVLDLNGNNFSSGSAVAAVDGTYRIPLTLPDGLDVLTVRATDGFGQQRTAATRVVLDATPPTVVAAATADFKDVAGSLRPDGAFLLTPAALRQVFGG